MDKLRPSMFSKSLPIHEEDLLTPLIEPSTKAGGYIQFINVSHSGGGCKPNSKPVCAIDTLQPPSTPAPAPPAVETTTTAATSGSASEDGDDATRDGPGRLRGAKVTPSPINLESDNDNDFNDAIRLGLGV